MLTEANVGFGVGVDALDMMVKLSKCVVQREFKADLLCSAPTEQSTNKCGLAG